MIYIPIRDNFELTREVLIPQGEHLFLIEDVDVKKTTQEGQTIQYITFALVEKPSMRRYDNLLSLPMSKKFKFSEVGILSKVLIRFGAITNDTTLISAELFNGLRGKEFSALVKYDGQFARIDENTIVPSSL